VRESSRVLGTDSKLRDILAANLESELLQMVEDRNNRFYNLNTVLATKMNAFDGLMFEYWKDVSIKCKIFMEKSIEEIK